MWRHQSEDYRNNTPLRASTCRDVIAWRHRRQRWFPVSCDAFSQWVCRLHSVHAWVQSLHAVLANPAVVSQLTRTRQESVKGVESTRKLQTVWCTILATTETIFINLLQV